jgi:hypothetical protein
MVITVNAWMNQPRGFTLNAHGAVATADPWVALFGHGFVWHELVHMYVAGYIVCGFVIAGVYSWGWLKGRRTAYHRAALVVPLTVACIAAPVQIVIGDWAGRTVAKEQPTKLAAMEGLPDTTRGAPFQFLGVYHASTNSISGGIEIPKLLSVLAAHNPDGTVQGLASVPRADRPPDVNVVRYAFQIMVGVGSALLVLTAWFLGSWWRWRRMPRANIASSSEEIKGGSKQNLALAGSRSRIRWLYPPGRSGHCARPPDSRFRARAGARGRRRSGLTSWCARSRSSGPRWTRAQRSSARRTARKVTPGSSPRHSRCSRPPTRDSRSWRWRSARPSTCPTPTEIRFGPR